MSFTISGVLSNREIIILSIKKLRLLCKGTEEISKTASKETMSEFRFVQNDRKLVATTYKWGLNVWLTVSFHELINGRRFTNCLFCGWIYPLNSIYRLYLSY